MSEATQQPAGTPAAFSFAGTEYSFTGVSLPLEQLVADIQEHLRSQQKQPWEVLNEAAKHVTDEKQLRLLAAECYADMKRGQHFVTPMEALLWMDSPAGLAWVIWRLLHTKYPQLTLETAEKVVQVLGVKAAKDIQKERVQ